MHITNLTNLRSSYIKKPTAIYAAIWFALVVHTVVLFYWNSNQKLSVPEIPDWMNITLVAGLEDNLNQKTSKPIAAKLPEPEDILKPRDKTEVVNETAVQPESVQDRKVEPEVKSSSANTLVQADSRPFALHNPKPLYPLSARRRGMQGVVLLQVSVSAKGHVTGVHILRSSGYRVLDSAATNSVKRWSFKPAHQGEDNVDSVVQVPVRFLLKK